MASTLRPAEETDPRRREQQRQRDSPSPTEDEGPHGYWQYNIITHIITRQPHHCKECSNWLSLVVACMAANKWMPPSSFFAAEEHRKRQHYGPIMDQC
jgi:hypothetical protein